MGVKRWIIDERCGWMEDANGDIDHDNDEYVGAGDHEALVVELAEAREQITSYQIAKDNLELRLVSIEHPHQQVY